MRWLNGVLAVLVVGCVSARSQSKINDITVFGASPTATAANNTWAINAALAANASNGYPVFVPSGTYQVNALTISGANVELMGDSSGLSHLQLAPGQNTSLLTVAGANSYIHNLALDENGGAQSGAGIGALTTSGVLSGMVLDMVAFENTAMGSSVNDFGLILKGVSNAQITRSSCSNTGMGCIRITGPAGVVVDNIRITNNTFDCSSATTTNFVCAYIDTTTGVTITNVVASNNSCKYPSTSAIESDCFVFGASQADAPTYTSVIGLTVNGNTITAVGAPSAPEGYGVEVASATTVSVTGNVINNAGEAGILVKSCYNGGLGAVTGNIITGDPSAAGGFSSGIFETQCPGWTFVGNNISGFAGSDTEGMWFADRAVVKGNAVQGFNPIRFKGSDSLIEGNDVNCDAISDSTGIFIGSGTETIDHAVVQNNNVSYCFYGVAEAMSATSTNGVVSGTVFHNMLNSSANTWYRDLGSTAGSITVIDSAQAYSAAGTPLWTSPSPGSRANVSDAASPSYLGNYTGGGAVLAPVMASASGAWVTY
jgi:hypothetical protein